MFIFLAAQADLAVQAVPFFLADKPV